MEGRRSLRDSHSGGVVLGCTQARKAPNRTSDSLRGFWAASIVGGRFNFSLPDRLSLHCPWEDIFAARSGSPLAAITRMTILPVRQFVTSGDAGHLVSDDGSFRTLFLRAWVGPTS